METRYRLKPNLTWHDGTALSAEDFVFAWRVYTTPELGFATAGTVPLAAMDEVLAPEANSLVLRWKRPFPGAGVLQTGGATNLGLPPLPRHILDAPYREDRDGFANLPYWRTEFVGLGPYRLDRWEPGAFIEGIAFAGHALGPAKIDRVRIVFIGDPNTAMANMRAGTVHFATEQSLTFEQALELKREWDTNHAGTFLFTTASMWFFEVQFRPEFATPRALADQRVRQALAHSLDKSVLSDVTWGGQGITLDTIFSPRLDYYPQIDQATAKYPFDLRAADRLMTEAGYTKGPDGTYASAEDGRLVFEVQAGGGPVTEAPRAIAASGWRQAGFDAQETTLPLALLLDGQARASYAGITTNVRNATDTAVTAAFTSGQVARADNRWNGTNRSGWANLDYDRLVEAFTTTLDPNERVQQRAAIARLFSQQLPAIVLFYHLNPTPHLAALTGPTQAGPDTTGFTGWNMHEWEMR
jgi:peptide/nickel transport system substrate-binding protein